MKRVLFAAALLGALLGASNAFAAPGAHAIQPHAPQVASAGPERSVGIIVKFKDPSTAPLAAELLSQATSSTARADVPSRGIYTFRSSPTDSDSQYSLKLMMASTGLDYAEPNYVRQIMSYTPPTDPDLTDTGVWYETVGSTNNYYLGAKHWWLDDMTAPQTWAIGQGSTYPVRASASQIKVAVLDTGMYLNHPDMNGGTIVSAKDECASYNPVTGQATTDNDVTPDATSDADFQSHGTATSAAVGAEINGIGMVGIGYQPIVLGYKVAGPITSAWSGYPAGSILILDSVVASATYDAVNAGAKVINMSFGGPDQSQAYQDAINYAHSHGVVVCASAGNDGGAVTEYPAACTYVTAVAALCRSGGSPTQNGTVTRSSFSDYANNVNDLAAPGEMFWDAYRPDLTPAGSDTQGYQFWAGTSFSSPAAAGAIAYLWRAMPDLTNDQIVSYVESSAVDLGTKGRDNYYGYGAVDMQAAYNKMIADYPTLAPPAITTTYAKPSSPVTWTASPGYNVSYLAGVDGSAMTSATGTSYTLPALSDGPHLVSVIPTSTRNWNSSSLATKTITIDSIAPVVGGFSLNGTSSVSWTVTEANPYTVQAYVDTGTPAAVAGNTFTLPSLPSGPHTLYVNATDAAGNSSGWRSWAFTTAPVAPAAPTLPSVVVTDALSATVSWPAVSGATSYEYAVNGGSSVATGGPGFVATGLSPGVISYTVRSLNGTMTSDWATATITDNLVVPATPAISAPANVATPSVTATWAPATNAKSYEYRLNGGASTPTTATTASFTGLPLGANAISVRSLDNFSASAWATATVTYAVPAPVISAPAMVWASTATVSWTSVAGATSYDVAVNGGPAASLTSTGTLVSGLTLGANTVSVRALQGANPSAWSSATITWAAPSPVTLTLSPSAVTVEDPATSAVLSAYISAPAETFQLQSSTDGVAWSDTAVAITSTATPAAVPVSVPVTSTAYFRLTFAGDNRWAPATSSVTTATYLAAVQPPALSDASVTDTLSAVFSWPSIPGAASYDYQLNGGSVTTTSGASFLASGLHVGANAVQVRTTDVSARQSAWATATITVVVLVPDAPQLSVPATTGLPSVSVSWPAANGALGYEYRLDGGSSASTQATSVALPLATEGTHTVEVRSLDNLSQSAWSSAQVVYTVPDPVLVAPTDVNTGSATISWVAVPGATVYEYSIDGQPTTTTAGTSVSATGLGAGTHTVEVRALQGANASDWVSATIDVTPQPQAAALVLVPSAARVAYPSTLVGLTAGFGAPNEHAVLQSSVDGGASWHDTGIGFTTTSAPTPVKIAAPVARTTRFRLSFAGDSSWLATTSPVVTVTYLPRMSTPTQPSSVRHARKFTASDVTNAPAANRSASVTFVFQRWQKYHGHNTWVTRKSVRVTGSVTSAIAMTFKVTTSLSSKGSYRVYASYSGAPTYGSASSSARSFRVR